MNKDKNSVPGVARAVPAEDLPRVRQMVAKPAEHHGDIATVTVENLVRDVLGGGPPGCAFWSRSTQKRLSAMPPSALCPLAQMQFGARGMDLQHLFVEASARRMGVGRMRIKAGQARARAAGCKYLVVGTHPQNVMVHGTYPAMGFDLLDPPGPRFRIDLAQDEQNLT